MFYGIIVSLYFFDMRRHHRPHIHVRYQDQEAVIAIPSGEVLEGELKPNKLILVQAWIEIHQDELIADWELASQGQPVFKPNFLPEFRLFSAVSYLLSSP